jgi:hypothetical protein
MPKVIKVSKDREMQKVLGYKCNHNDCIEQFKKEEDLVNHITNHQRFPCLISGCDYTFSWRKTRKIHISSFHRKDFVKIKCTECDQLFNNKKEKKIHIKICNVKIKENKIMYNNKQIINNYLDYNYDIYKYENKLIDIPTNDLFSIFNIREVDNNSKIKQDSNIKNVFDFMSKEFDFDDTSTYSFFFKI